MKLVLIQAVETLEIASPKDAVQVNGKHRLVRAVSTGTEVRGYVAVDDLTEDLFEALDQTVRRAADSTQQ